MYIETKTPTSLSPSMEVTIAKSLSNIDLDRVIAYQTYSSNSGTVIATLNGTIINNIYGTDTNCLTPPSISTDGSLVAVYGNEIELRSLNNTDQIVSKIKTKGGAVGISWSPDGKYIVFGDGINGPYDLFMANVDGSNIRNITNHDVYSAYPDWAPEGNEIVFTGSDGVYVINQQSGTLRRVATYTSGTPYAPRWSPDGTKIAYVLNHIGADGHNDYIQVYVVDASGTQAPIPISDRSGWTYPVVWIDNSTLLAFNYSGEWYYLVRDSIKMTLSDVRIPGWCIDIQP